MLNRRAFVAGCVAAGAGAALQGKENPENPEIQITYRLPDGGSICVNGVWKELAAGESFRTNARDSVEVRFGGAVNITQTW
jgi:hypothetical protein